ncbi:(d)CMP kinase [Vagococcus sp. BWB3-3]|uniref:Cytidylate kinase n=1 Tax=Vagococcus allomyrinae TaxID=2794353 RepID=A0A940P8X0_9ENTE|nr:(d)CMP kinase [Vagococcus allomyrinae]MBP1040614.1 (d)CMP kinase [Vagococcus allomyrinae]
MSGKISIAIDGPASAGKSTVAKILAKDLGYIYVDTGAMYRAITYASLEQQVDPSDEQKLSELVRQLTISFKQGTDGQLVFLGDRDITEAIRQPNVTNLVSQVSAHKEIRLELVRRQRQLATSGGVVMDGRDIGTAVLPQAEVKIFLVASVDERAERRYKENIAKGIMTDYESLKAEIEARDYKDSTRENSPLVQAEDAIRLDTTGLSINEVVTSIKNIIKNKVK